MKFRLFMLHFRNQLWTRAGSNRGRKICSAASGSEVDYRSYFSQ
jgi:hypothetical protein